MASLARVFALTLTTLVCVPLEGWNSALVPMPLGPSTLIARRRSLLVTAVAAQTETEESTMPLVGAPFEVDSYPTSADEMIETYTRWCASRGQSITVEEARRDVQCFMANEELASKWRPILQQAAKEKAKLSPVELINLFTSYALPIAVGLTILPLIRTIGEQIPFVNDVVIPQIDQGVTLVKKGVQRVIELPICLEFGDC